LKFIDPIDHLNICDQTGEVLMPLLKDDWCPYISLYSILENLDALLLEPEQSFAFLLLNEKDTTIKQIKYTTSPRNVKEKGR
jgi:ubiquitin-protein ligase